MSKNKAIMKQREGKSVPLLPTARYEMMFKECAVMIR